MAINKNAAPWLVSNVFAVALAGCATTPTEAPFWLSGTRWAVEDVNRDNVSARTDYVVKFSGTTFEARFGCRRASGTYRLREASNGDPTPIYEPSNGVVSGKACTGNPAEKLGPELITRATFSLERQPDGRLIFAEPPTFMTLRPLPR